MISRTSVLVPVLTVFAIAAVAMPQGPASAQTGEPIALMAADVNTAGNTATAFGPVDGCLRVEAGTEFDIDVGVDAIPDGRGMIAFEFSVTYDPALLEVVSSDNGLLLAANGVFEPFIGNQDPFPDTDGTFAISVLDTASNAPNAGDNTETGPGVLTRVRLRAVAAGQSNIGIGYDVNDAGTFPVIIDFNAGVIPIERVQGGIVAIGQDCPTTGGGEPVPPIDQPPPPFDSINTPEPTPPPGPGETPVPGDGTPAAGTPDPNASPSPSGSPRPSGSPSPSASPGSGSDSDDDGGSDLLIIIGALVLALLGIVAAGAGAWFLLRRVQPAEPTNGNEPPPAPPESGDNP